MGSSDSVHMSQIIYPPARVERPKGRKNAIPLLCLSPHFCKYRRKLSGDYDYVLLFCHVMQTFMTNSFNPCSLFLTIKPTIIVAIQLSHVHGEKDNAKLYILLC